MPVIHYIQTAPTVGKIMEIKPQNYIKCVLLYTAYSVKCSRSTEYFTPILCTVYTAYYRNKKHKAFTPLLNILFQRTLFHKFQQNWTCKKIFLDVTAEVINYPH